MDRFSRFGKQKFEPSSQYKKNHLERSNWSNFEPSFNPIQFFNHYYLYKMYVNNKMYGTDMLYRTYNFWKFLKNEWT